MLALLFYIVYTLFNTDFQSTKAFIVFLVCVFPYILKNLIGCYYLMYSLFQKSKDIDDSNLAVFISLLAANLSIFIGLFNNLKAVNPNSALVYWSTILSLAVFPFYFAGLITLGRNLTILPEANSLNTKGVYSISRHPLYLCYIVWFILQILICQTWLMAFISIIQIALTILRAKLEEQILEKNFPEYKEYRKTVRWLGRIQNYQRPISLKKDAAS